MEADDIHDRKTSNRTGKIIGSYLRELSVVVIGVLITLMITGMVNSCSRQKELKGMLSLVTGELKENVSIVEKIWRNYEGEQHIFEILRGNNFRVEDIPLDTLEKYDYAIGRLYSLDIKSDSYEVLKSSVLTQYVKEQGLLTDLSAAYGSLSDLNGLLKQYSNRKSESLYPMMDNMETEQIDRWMNGTQYEWFDYPLKERAFRTFLITGPTLISPGTYGSCKKIMENVIRDLERYGYKEP